MASSWDDQRVARSQFRTPGRVERVLLARLRSHLRRHPQEPTSADPICIGDLTIDTNPRLCRVGDTEIALRTKKFDLSSPCCPPEWGKQCHGKN